MVKMAIFGPQNLPNIDYTYLCSNSKLGAFRQNDILLDIFHVNSEYVL